MDLRWLIVKCFFERVQIYVRDPATHAFVVPGEFGITDGNIFHGALTFPFAETSETIGTWGVETEFPNVLFCGSSARRGGAVSGIPGHNAAMKVLETLSEGSSGRIT